MGGYASQSGIVMASSMIVTSIVSFQVKRRTDFMELAVYVPIKEVGSK